MPNVAKYRGESSALVEIVASAPAKKRGIELYVGDINVASSGHGMVDTSSLYHIHTRDTYCQGIPDHLWGHP
jgi:hypothetical protein